jgi:hypothetical protein
MRKIIAVATIASLALGAAAPAARANDWGGLAGGLAGGIIAGAIASQMQQPRTVYVPVERRHYVAPRPAQRVIVVHDHTVVHTVTPAPVAAPVAVPVPAAAPANNNNVVVAPAPAPAPIIINNSPAPAPQPIVINAGPAPAASAPNSATADHCQGFEKTADYLACQRAVAAK